MRTESDQQRESQFKIEDVNREIAAIKDLMARDSNDAPKRMDYQKKIELLNRLSKLLELLTSYFKAMAREEQGNQAKKDNRNFKNVFKLIQRFVFEFVRGTVLMIFGLL